MKSIGPMAVAVCEYRGSGAKPLTSGLVHKPCRPARESALGTSAVLFLLEPPLRMLPPATPAALPGVEEAPARGSSTK